MFRRRLPFKPPLPPLGLPGLINPVLMRILGEANRAFETGDYGIAAERFTRLAQRAVLRGKVQAGNWLIKAGQANVLNGTQETGLHQVIQGLEMLRAQERQRDLERFARNTVDLFNGSGFHLEADKVVKWVQNTTSGSFSGSPVSRADETNRQQLPSICPSCGAPVHPQTVDWVKNGQAACGYCGIILPEE